jgi:hypothetical protein
MTLCVPIMTGVGNGPRWDGKRARPGRRLMAVAGLPPPVRNAMDQIS